MLVILINRLMTYFLLYVKIYNLFSRIQSFYIKFKKDKFFTKKEKIDEYLS